MAGHDPSCRASSPVRIAMAVCPKMAPMRSFSRRAGNIKQSGIREVTRRIEAVGGVNLGQGTCALPPHPAVLAAAHRALDAGHNSYTFFDGVRPLKEAIAWRYGRYNDLNIAPEHVLVTAGATGGLECACKVFLDEGDEVVLFEPIYQYHVRLVEERGAIPRLVRLQSPDWTFDPAELERAFSPRTKLLVFANPNNPTGKVFTREELLTIGDACRRHGVVAVSDEVYEYILSEGHRHLSLAALPGMFDHTLTLSSASKTLFVTGWRVGWVVGPPDILQPLGVKSDETYVCAPAPLQYAVAEALRLDDSFFEGLRTPFLRRRDRLCAALRAAGLTPQTPAGAYYVLAGYEGLRYGSDQDAMMGLIERAGVGSVAGVEFFPSEGARGRSTGLLRFCFALMDDLLESGCERLVRQSLEAR